VIIISTTGLGPLESTQPGGTIIGFYEDKDLPLLSRAGGAGYRAAELKPTSLTGTWRITEVKTAGLNPSTNSNPQPGLYIFTGEYFSAMSASSDWTLPGEIAARKSFADQGNRHGIRVVALEEGPPFDKRNSQEAKIFDADGVSLGNRSPSLGQLLTSFDPEAIRCVAFPWRQVAYADAFHSGQVPDVIQQCVKECNLLRAIGIPRTAELHVRDQ
jgi:hypothetical protein